MDNLRSLLAALLLVCFGFGAGVLGDGDGEQFVYSGFAGANATLALDGTALVQPSGLLELTNGTAQLSSHAVHRTPLRLRRSPGDAVRSFSASFVFGIIPPYSELSGHGIVFFVGKDNFSAALPSQYLGLLNSANNGNATNQIFGVELDTIQSTEFNDTNDNHVGIDVNSLKSVAAHSAGYYDDETGAFNELLLISGKAMQVWVDYESDSTQISVFLAPLKNGAKPSTPLVYAEVREEWEVEFGPHRFTYKDLFRATEGFKNKTLLGFGGFGRGYKGALPKSKLEVAVKKVSHESRQGIKEFVAEVVTIGRLRHRNLVQLLGYCRRKGELLLVYDYMSNGSLDKYLYSGSKEKPALDWAQRFRIIKGVASGLLYIHEDFEQVIIHRDIKASNVLYDHGPDPQTTHVVGTMGYLAPELARTGKASPLTDVFAFGAFILEVACGRRPVEQAMNDSRLMLVDWVLEHWQKESLLEVVDARLDGNYDAGEVVLALKLGLMCSHPMPGARPSMRQVMQYLEGDMPIPELTPTQMSFSMLALMQSQGFDSFVLSATSDPSSATNTMMTMGTISGLSGGR
ncbi:L-type lectin-domain containing receptor kinase IV.2 [Triticum urartu]|uniref:non-specific serine/threonine protein kinase n=1 Tax=Triticum urartu TaxID=4572 RepID=M7Y717_TRIUA|nr:L-type lectin-domain containing receptor kinase IV.2 [Triticum urartu]